MCPSSKKHGVCTWASDPENISWMKYYESGIVPLRSLNKFCFSFLLSFFSFLFSTSFVPFTGVWHYKRQSSTTSNHNQITCLVRLFFFSQKRGGLKALIVWNISMAENWELGIRNFSYDGNEWKIRFPCIQMSSIVIKCDVMLCSWRG